MAFYGYHQQMQFQSAAMQFAQFGLPPPPDINMLFQQVANDASRNHLGQIDAEQLQWILNNSEFATQFRNRNFSLETCKVMTAMLDRDCSGLMSFPEFQELLGCLFHWRNAFFNYDTDRSGHIDAFELNNVIASFGFRLSQLGLQALLRRYSKVVMNRPTIAFDDFVACCVRLRALTDAFRLRDAMQNGQAMFNYDEFIQVAMGL